VSLKLVRRKGSPHLYLRGTVRGQSVFETTGTDNPLAAEPCRTPHFSPSPSSEPLTAVFGVTDRGLARRLLEQVVNVVHAGSEQPIDERKIENCLAAVRAIAPVGGLEAMIATMLVPTFLGT
jgi:hypothetical protein